MFTAKSSQETIVLIYTLTKNISRPILHPRPLQFLNLSKVASSPNGSVVKNPPAMLALSALLYKLSVPKRKFNGGGEAWEGKILGVNPSSSTF